MTVLCLLSMVVCACTHKSDEDRFIDNLLARMTLEEKIGQMNQLDPSYDSEAKEALIREGRVGSVFNIIGVKEVNRLQRMAVEQTRLGIPLVVARDVIHGFHTVYPIPLGQAASWDPELVEQTARLTAKEAYAHGVRWAFSPMVDVAHDPRWGRIAEGYGEDPLLTSVMGAATVKGYQHHIPDTQWPAVAACVKHFAGYAVSEGGRDYNTTWIPEVQFRDIYLPPFKAALEAGSMSLMCSFNAINGLPSSANKHLNIDILRHEWHSDALLVSDWGSGSDLVPHGLCADKKEAALRCINARMEMDMQGNIYTDYLPELVKEKLVSERMINECVRSVLRLKYRLGLFENPYVPEDDDTDYAAAAVATATRAAEESAILLKNNGILPIAANRSPFTVLICGPMADQKKEQLGTWIFDGQPELSVTPLEAFRQMAGSGELKGQVLYEPGLTYSRQKQISGRQQLLDKARQADVILFFAGEEAILSGEARCRTDINLPGAQPEMMEALAATGKPVVLVVMAGRPLTIGKQVDEAAAVLYAFHGGTYAGPALYNVLTGKVVPSGKTPMTFPKMVGQIPLYYNRLNTGRPTYDPPVLIDDIPVGAPQFSVGYSSCWLETATEPLFPFGFGLSYTTFEYGETLINGQIADGLTVSCSITNTGTVDACEVAQLYSRQISGALARPICELRGFRKVFIPAGESRTVTFTLTPEDLGYWHDEWKDDIHRVWFATDDAEFRFRIAPYAEAL
jgi:beta-glucosidase